MEIERGRFNRKPLPIESRVCKQCQINKVDEVEDEKHFLMQCPAYSLQRSKLIDQITQKFPRFLLLDESEKFVWILSQDDSEAIHWVSNFIFSAMKKRRKTLELLLITSQKSN